MAHEYYVYQNIRIKLYDLRDICQTFNKLTLNREDKVILTTDMKEMFYECRDLAFSIDIDEHRLIDILTLSEYYCIYIRNLLDVNKLEYTRIRQFIYQEEFNLHANNTTSIDWIHQALILI
jgi:hypothetical protein